MDNFIVIPMWLAWCLLIGLAFNAVGHILVFVRLWRESRRRSYIPTPTRWL